MHTCRAANLKYLLRDDEVYEAAEEMIDALEYIENEDRRGTRLRETFSLRRVKPSTEPGILGVPEQLLLAETLNRTYGAGTFTLEGSPVAGPVVLLSQKVAFMSVIQLNGVSYKSHRASPKDSYICFTLTNSTTLQAARIDSIFSHTRRSTVRFFVLREPALSQYAADIRGRDDHADICPCEPVSGARQGRRCL